MNISTEAKDWLRTFFDLWSDHTTRIADHYQTFSALPYTVKHEIEAVTAEEPVTAFSVCAAPSILLAGLGYQKKWNSSVITSIGECSTRRRSAYDCTHQATPSALLGCLSVLVDALFRCQDDDVAQLVGVEIINQIATNIGGLAGKRMEIMEDLQKAMRSAAEKANEPEKVPEN